MRWNEVWWNEMRWYEANISSIPYYSIYFILSTIISSHIVFYPFCLLLYSIYLLSVISSFSAIYYLLLLFILYYLLLLFILYYLLLLFLSIFYYLIIVIVYIVLVHTIGYLTYLVYNEDVAVWVVMRVMIKKLKFKFKFKFKLKFGLSIFYLALVDLYLYYPP